MAKDIKMNFILTGDNTQLKRVIEETRARLGNPIEHSNLGSPITPVASDKAEMKGKDSEFIALDGGFLEIQKKILDELHGIKSLFGNKQGPQQQQTQGKASRLGNPIEHSNSGSPITPVASDKAEMKGKDKEPEDSERSSFLEPVTTESVFKDMLQELKVLSNHFIRGNGNPSFINSAQNNGQKTSKTKEDGRIKTLAATAALGIESGLIAYNTGNARVRMAEYQGDYFGSQIARNNRTANAITTGTSVIPLVSAIAGSFIPGIGPMVGAAVGEAFKKGIDTFVGSRNENKNVKIEEKQLLSDTYKGRLRLNEESLAMYGRNIENNTAKQNASQSMQMQSYFNTQSKNTGMELDEFQDLANSYSKYGVENYVTAGNLARTTALTQSYTGADATEFLGTQTRLGKDTGKAADAMNFAFGASLASGLSKGQFSEFLTGLERAVEDGISEGYIKATDEVSKTMVMFSKLSGNDPTLKGEYGFRMLKQMDSGLKNATGLSSTSHLLAFQALSGLNDGKQGVAHIDGQDALNTLAYMEGGLDTNKFTAISKRFSAQYGDDTMEKILAIKDLYGVNYNGAMKISRLQDRAASGDYVSNDEIKKVMASPEYNTDQKNMVNYLNDIKSNTSILGEGSFRKYLEGLAGIDDKYRQEKEFNEKYGIDYGVDLSQKEKGILENLRKQGENGTAGGYYEMQLATIVAGLNNDRLNPMVHGRLNSNALDTGNAEAIETAAIVEAIKQGFRESELSFRYE